MIKKQYLVFDSSELNECLSILVLAANRLVLHNLTDENFCICMFVFKKHLMLKLTDAEFVPVSFQQSLGVSNKNLLDAELCFQVSRSKVEMKAIYHKWILFSRFIVMSILLRWRDIFSMIILTTLQLLILRHIYVLVPTTLKYE